MKSSDHSQGVFGDRSSNVLVRGGIGRVGIVPVIHIQHEEFHLEQRRAVSTWIDLWGGIKELHPFVLQGML